MNRAGWAIAKSAVFAAALSPLVMLGWAVAFGPLGADPYPPAIQETGSWSLRLLLLGLALAPLGRITGWGSMVRFRRMIGLFAAFYALLHVAIWAKDYGFDWGFLAGELMARRHLAVGALGVLLLVPLAATSTDGAHRRLGTRAWRRLHTLVYPAAILAYVHFVMAGRVTGPETLLDGAILAALLVWRIAARLRRAPSRPLRV